MLNQNITLKKDKWEVWGFKSSPFDHCALQANDHGASLLVGRDLELQQTLDSLTRPKIITALNGGIGVGKTSLANVAIFHLQELARTESPHTLYICCENNIEFSYNDSFTDLEFKIYTEVANAIIAYRAGNSNDSWRSLYMYDEVKALIKNPLFRSRGINIAPIGGIDISSSPNNSESFGKEGFIQIIKDWVHDYFPSSGNGFFLCVIDNFELMDEASRIFEILRKNRDQLFNIDGMKYVICGANNSTLKLEDQWLSSFIDARIEVPNISMKYASEIYKTRINYHKRNENFYIPLTEASFVKLAEAIKANVRDLLGEAEKFCSAQYRANITLPNDAEKEIEFTNWLDKQTQNILTSIKDRMTKNCWKTLINGSTMPFDGNFTSSDHEGLDIPQGSYSNTLSRLKELKLITEEVDENHRKKRNYKLTPKAYYALHANNNPAINLESIMNGCTESEDEE